jgi:hypothetical protein
VGFTARNGTVAVHRPASDEYVDIVETAAVVAELGITVAEFCFVFALAGSDFTSGIAGFSHTSIVKMYQANHAWITDNKRDPLAQVGTDGQLTFSMEGWRRLALTLYYERSKGGQNGVNYIVPGGDQNRGRTLAALYTAQGMDAAYRTVRTTVHEHTGKESRALASWGQCSAMPPARFGWPSITLARCMIGQPPTPSQRCTHLRRASQRQKSRLGSVVGSGQLWTGLSESAGTRGWWSPTRQR